MSRRTNGGKADQVDILRVFDLSASYGPCVGVTRLQRWERAKKWGLNPPEEVSDFSLYMSSFGEIKNYAPCQLVNGMRLI